MLFKVLLGSTPQRARHMAVMMMVPMMRPDCACEKHARLYGTENTGTLSTSKFVGQNLEDLRTRIEYPNWARPACCNS